MGWGTSWFLQLDTNMLNLGSRDYARVGELVDFSS